MSMDVVDLREFYSRRLGIVARQMINRGIRERWPSAASGWGWRHERKRQLDLWTARIRPAFATGLPDQRQTLHRRLRTTPSEVARDTVTKERFPHTVS